MESPQTTIAADSIRLAKDTESACEDAIRALRVPPNFRRILSLYKEQLQQLAGLSRLVACNATLYSPFARTALESIIALIKGEYNPSNYTERHQRLDSFTDLAVEQLKELHLHQYYVNLTRSIEEEKQNLLMILRRAVERDQLEWSFLSDDSLNLLPGLREYEVDLFHLYLPGNVAGVSLNLQSLNASLSAYDEFPLADRITKFEDDSSIPLRHISPLGTGGYSRVDKVEHRTTGIIYARKTFRAQSIKKAREELQKEVDNLNFLRRICQHRHIVELVGAYQWKRDLALLLRPAATHDLSSFLNDPLVGFNLDVFLPTMFGCLSHALWYIHSQNVRHRDIKPGNILVNDGVVILTDFGLSKQFLEVDSQTAGQPEMTKKYSAPEVMSWDARGRAADIFSLGCVFLEILACILGHTPDVLADLIDQNDDWEDDGIYYKNLTKISSWIKGQEPFIVTSHSTISGLIMRMLSFDSDLRPSARTILNELFHLTESSLYTPFCPDCFEAFSQVLHSNNDYTHLVFPDFVLLDGEESASESSYQVAQARMRLADEMAEMKAENTMQTLTTEEEFAMKMRDAVWKTASSAASDKIQ